MTPPSSGAITFERLGMADLPLMHRWLNTPHVRRWWADEPRTLDEIARHYGARISGEDPTNPFLVLLDDTPIGYIQSYRIADHPDYAEHVLAPGDEEAAGIDLFIGEPNLVGRGLGPRLIRQFLRDVVFGASDATCCLIGPATDNAAAIRAYEKAGFCWVRTVAVPGEPSPEYLMRLAREGLLNEPRAGEVPSPTPGAGR